MSKIKLPLVAFEITSICNLRCRYCYNYWNAPTINTFLHFNSYKQSIKTLKKLFSVADVGHMTFTGGEPFMAERFVETVLYARMKKKSVTIITNGTRSNENSYRQLVEIGVQMFELPIHSYLSDVHDRMTNLNGSHGKVLETIRILSQLDVHIVAVVVLTKINANHIADTLLFIKQLGITRIMLNRFNIGGRGIDNNEELQLSEEELQTAFKSASETALQQKITVSSNVCTPICILNPNDYRGISFTFCSADVKNRPLTLELNGNLRFCNHSPVVLGNIFTDKLELILNNDKTKLWEGIPEYCVDCQVFERCRGGCRAASEQMNLSAKTVDPIIHFLKIQREAQQTNFKQ